MRQQPKITRAAMRMVLAVALANRRLVSDRHNFPDSDYEIESEKEVERAEKRLIRYIAQLQKRGR